MMASERKDKPVILDNKISAKQLHNVVRSKVRIQNDKAKQHDSIRLEKDQFEKRMNREAKALLKKMKVPPIICPLNTKNDLKLPDINGSGSNSTPSSPLLGRQKFFNDKASRAESPSVLALPPSPRRGSVNNIDTLTLPSSPLVNRRGSFHSSTEISSPFQSPSSSPLLERRRMTLGVISPLNAAKPGPVTKHLVMRQSRRMDSIASSTSPPPSPSPLEEQFRALETCRYLRSSSSLEDDGDKVGNDNL